MVMPRWSIVYSYLISNVMVHIFIVWIPKDVRLIMIVPHTCGTAALVTLVSNAWRSSMQMDFWSLLITNHLTHANHASWEKWPRLRSPEQWSEQPTYWKSYILMCVVQWALRLAEDIIMFSLSLTTWVDMGMSTSWNTSLRPLKSSRNFRVRLRINVTGKSSSYDQIVRENIWVTNLART